MTPQAQSQFDQLEKIKQTLGGISNTIATMPKSELARVENTDIGKGVSGVLGAAGNVFSDLQVEKGVLTSRSAQQAVNSANKTITRSGGSTAQDPFAALQQQNAQLQKAFEQEKATRAGLEADLSITNQQNQNNQIATTTGADGKTVTTPQGNEMQTPGDTTVLPGLENDPVANALVTSANEKIALTNQRMEALKKITEAEDSDTKQLIKLIESQAQAQATRVEKENERLSQAARVAGIVSGRGMYSPYEHEGLISEVVQEGLARIQSIENTKIEAIMGAKKAQREFNYKAFVEMSDMVERLSDLKRDTILDMNKRMQEIEKSEREKMVFDQQQADRNAFILAPELMNATPEQITAAALANGIDVGLLSREVQQYKDEQRMTKLDIEGKELGNESARENIKTQQYNRYLSSLKASGTADATKDLKAMSKAEQEQFQGSYGWTPPFGMSFEEALRIEETFAGEPNGVKSTRAKEVMVGQNKSFIELANEDIKTLSESDEAMKKAVGEIGKSLGLKTIWRTARGTDEITTNPQFQSYVQEAIAEAEAIGITLSTRQMVDLISEMVAQDNELATKRKAEEAETARVTAQPDEFRTANTTQAVRLK